MSFPIIPVCTAARSPRREAFSAACDASSPNEPTLTTFAECQNAGPRVRDTTATERR
jgi:hypothetical protein